MPMSNRPAWRYYRQFYQGAYPALAASVLVAMVQGFVLLPVALLVRVAFDRAIPAHSVGLLVAAGGGVLALYLLNAAAGLWVRGTILDCTKRAIQRLRDDLLARIYSLSREEYSHADLGRLHTAFVQDTERLDTMSNALVAQLLPAVVTALVLGAVLVYLNWALFLVLAVTTPALLLCSRLLGRRVRERIRRFHRSFETFSSGIAFILRSLDLTTTQAAERFERERQGRRHDELRRVSGAMAWLQAAYVLAQNTIADATGVLILIAGGAAVATSSMTIGGLLSFYVTASLLKDAIYTITTTTPQVIAGGESLATLYRLATTGEPRPYTGHAQFDFGGRLALEGVSFQYGEAPLLRDLDLEIHPGATVAITGPNGAGKSTILSLILGFYRPQRGRLTADGWEYDALDMACLRRAMGVVLQEAPIVSGTIAENIAYGAPEAASDEIERAARLATAHDFIAALPAGYATLVGEAGTLLSGGQRQRVAIARALLRRPRLLMFDEPTNHLDAASLRALMCNLRALDNAPAIVIISHDTEVIAECDVVYALEQGRLVRRAAHRESAESAADAADATKNGREPAGVHPSYATGERIGS